MDFAGSEHEARHSMVLAGDVLLMLTLDGDLRVAKVSAEDYSRTGEVEGEREEHVRPPRASPATALFVKGPEKLLCYELK